MKRNRKRVTAIALALLAIGSLTGCSTVEPWQKGNLTEYGMRDDRDALAGVATAHIQFSREASTGGAGVGGGGCGCN